MGHIIDEKGLKMLEKRKKIEFSDLTYLLFSGTPLPPNGKSSKIVTIKWFKKGQNQHFWTKNACFLVKFFLNLGVPPPSPQRIKYAE